ncbi:MAG: beta-propeller domain-containing protein [Eubacterium sp.]|nr:beta-propeller domain-containing protein [Eubacterium sp.]
MKKRDLENFDFIKSKFDEAMPDVPFSLDEQAIERKIVSEEEHKIIKIKSNTNYKAIASAAACLLLFFGLLFAVVQSNVNPPVNTPVQIETFKNYEELNTMIDTLNNRGAQANAILEASDFPKPQLGGGSDEEHSNNQTNGVVDADTVVTDGRYIYYSDENSSWDGNFSVLRIYRVNGSETEFVAEINTDAENSKIFIKDMFLYNNRLVVNITNYNKDAYISHSDDLALTRIYDVSNPEKPKLVSEFSQTGEYISAKMIGNIAYVVSSYSVPENAKDHRIPEIANGNEKAEIKAENITYFDDACNAQYAVISPINIETGERAGETKAVLGASKYVYCTKDSIYLLKYSVEFGQQYLAEVSELNTDELSIIRADINNGEILFTASGKVNGYIDSVNVMNERNGFFTIITTKLDKQDKPIANTLYVLDENLKVVGKTEDFAAGKRVQAALFTDNKAYVSLFYVENVFAVVDLSNKAKPVIENSLEFNGSIMKLVPINKNQILGLGRPVEFDDDNWYEHGLKLVLLDVSSENIKIIDDFETDTYSLKGLYDTDLLIDDENNSYIIPIDYMDEEGRWSCDGLLRFHINNNHFEINEDTDEFFNEYVENYHCPCNIESEIIFTAFLFLTLRINRIS